jgi:beta,beta-carotene 9',10'-dioxygenase
VALAKQARSRVPALGFADLEEELVRDSLPLQGDLPPWLSGSLVRVTPAKFRVGERRANHWFDGLAMLNRFGFADGQVSYASRFLDTRAYRGAQAGEWSQRGFATDPCRTLFQRVQSIFSPELTDNANVNMAQVGERYIALTETPLPIEFDAETLATLGRFAHDDKLGGQVTTAHPHHDPERRELVNYVVRLGLRTEYVVYGMPVEGNRRRTIARLPVKQPSYMHSFGSSERHLILAENPLRLNPLRLAASNRPFIDNYRWDPDAPARFLVVDRDSGELRGSYETDAFFCFHHVNAFERGDELVVDLIAYEDASIITAFYLDGELGEPSESLPGGELRRYTIDLDGGGVRHRTLAEGALELPRIAYGSRNGRDYTYVYAAGVEGDWLDRLVKVDVCDGTRRVWESPGCYPGEPVLVARPGASAEDDGVVLSVVLDAEAERSFLLVLDAASFDELARAEAPHHIPFGFHGQFVR